MLSGKFSSALSKNNGINNTILLVINFTFVQALFSSSYMSHDFSLHNSPLMWVLVSTLIHTEGK